MRKVEVCSYNEKANEMFAEEAEKLNLIFGKEMVDIYHIGSTSVQGLKSKPIIGMLPVVKDIEKVDQYNDEMKKIGYQPKGENGIPGRRYFKKGEDNRTHHVHMYQIGSDEIKRHLVFRDYLRNHPDVMKSYGDLKEKLAKQFPCDIDSYINGKDPFVREIEEKALNWFNELI